MVDYVMVDFEKIDPKLIKLIPYGGRGYKILYNGKRLYVKYGKRKCRGGLVKWPNGGITFGISLPDGDPYNWRAYDIDWHFHVDRNFGCDWTGIVSGDAFPTMYFSVPTDGEYFRTKFFGQSYGGMDAIPKKSDISILALWDMVSVSDMYGAVIRPKAIQVNVINLDKTHYDEDGPCMFYSEEVRRY